MVNDFKGWHVNSNYSEALEQQAALAQHMSAHLVADRLNSTDQAIYRAVRYGQTFWLDGDPTSLVHAGAKTLPSDTPLNMDVLPSRQGFVLSSQVHSLVIDSQIPGPIKLRGFLWDSLKIRRGDDPSQLRGLGVGVMPLFTANHGLFADTLYPWTFGDSIAVASSRNKEFSTSEHPSSDSGKWVLRLFLSFCLFLQQRIIVAMPTTAERGARRRLQRAGWLDEPVVRVIQLRRRDHVGDRHAVEPVERDWQCQWMVRGHWRQQFYPSKQANQPIWITPYVKGPEDKPLKPPRATVFAVVR